MNVDFHPLGVVMPGADGPQFRIRCSVCSKPVEGWAAAYDVYHRTYVIKARCHGEVDTAKISEASLRFPDVRLAAEMFAVGAFEVTAFGSRRTGMLSDSGDSPQRALTSGANHSTPTDND